MRRAIAAGALLYLGIVGSAVAQDCGTATAPPGSGPPILHLSETASTKVQPTLLVAQLQAVGHAANAVAAQRSVNSLMNRAGLITVGRPGIETAFLDYETSFVEPDGHTPGYWMASQTIEISGQNGGEVLDLVGHLQALGLATTDLSWQVPEAQEQAAKRSTTIKALSELRQDAEAAASALDLRVHGYAAIDLTGGPNPGPFPQPMFAAVRMAAAMPAPQSTAQPEEISETVSADVVLAPRITPGAPQQAGQHP
jgi:uncharacterized protein YggE